MVNKARQKGISIIETLLVISILTVVTMLALQKKSATLQLEKSILAGKQLLNIGKATEEYLLLHYKELTLLQSAPTTPTVTDPGPRLCNVATSLCTITVATLANEGLLPPMMDAATKNALGLEYKIQIKISGVAPDKQVKAIVMTVPPSTSAATSTLADLGLTRKMVDQALSGGDAHLGMVNSIGNLSGLRGQWTETSVEFPDLFKTTGFLGYRTSLEQSKYAGQMLRSGDRTLTGDLEMNGANIKNAVSVSTISAAFTGKSTIGNLATGALDINDTLQVTSGVSAASTSTSLLNTEVLDTEVATLGATTTIQKDLVVQGEITGPQMSTEFYVTAGLSCQVYTKVGAFLNLDFFPFTVESGALAPNSSGVVLSCQNGIWTR